MKGVLQEIILVKCVQDYLELRESLEARRPVRHF